MPASLIERLQTPYRTYFARKLSANFRPMGKVGEVTHGQLQFRDAATKLGLIITETNVKDAALHTIEISQTTGTAFGAPGGTPSAASVTGGRAWDPVVFAATTPGLVITASNANPVGTGQKVVNVP